MAIITVSRQMGAQAELVIAGVAKALDLRVVDRALIGRAALAAGVPEVVFEELTYEGQRGLVQRMIELMGILAAGGVRPSQEMAESVSPWALPFGGAFAAAFPSARDTAASLERYVQVIGMVIRDLAEQGNVLIVGMGGQAILREEPRAIHVQILAAFEDRLRRIMERDKCTRGEALRRLRASDEARGQYLRRHYGVDWMEPTLYHLVLNTSRLGVAGAVRAIVAVARHWEPDGIPPKMDSGWPAGGPEGDETDGI
ncbi:MAG: cytidylate kinase-like family protein [Anaerolineae bacterium]